MAKNLTTTLSPSDILEKDLKYSAAPDPDPDNYISKKSNISTSVEDVDSISYVNDEESEASTGDNESTTTPSSTDFRSPTSIDQNELLYGIEDSPPWYLCAFLGFQHYLEMIGATIACPFILTPALCMEDDDPNKANIISTLIFMSGIITILQSTVGTRLPIVQGGSFSYLVPSLAIMSLPQWKCPPNMGSLTPDEKTELWQVRMREIQGAIIFAALFQVLFAVTGKIPSRHVTPRRARSQINYLLDCFRLHRLHCQIHHSTHDRSSHHNDWNFSLSECHRAVRQELLRRLRYHHSPN